MQKKLLLFGGTGFTGSYILRKALSRGYQVVVATRGGAPPPGSPLEALERRVRQVGGRAAALESFEASPASSPPPTSTTAAVSDLVRGACQMDAAAALQFVSLDATSRDQVFHFLKDHPDATAVINAVGCLTRDYDLARQLNGDVMTNIAAGVYHPRLAQAVQKVVYLSAAPYHHFARRTLGSRPLLKGYFLGKSMGEKAVLMNLGRRGVVLQPTMIYGPRPIAASPSWALHGPSDSPDGTSSSIILPLQWIGRPLEMLCTAIGGRKLLLPPINVEVVAEVAVLACEAAAPDSSKGSDDELTGILDVYQMQEVYRRHHNLFVASGNSTAAIS